MKCFVCRFGEIEPGVTTYNLNHDPMTLVVKNVPASVCDSCGEGHLEPEVSVRLQEIVKEARTAGVEFMVRKYTPARTPHKANGVQRQPVEEFLAKLSLSKINTRRRSSQTDFASMSMLPVGHGGLGT